ncbi:SDR family oxidoreductase [Denitromonas ohlonensis]|uniref:Peroxisomal trans-2-enoyl-CoA reductase n=2 Tax=Denitromonas TaxID=139331 RepID=A0A557REG0_9RHOO|nr:SDR family oxidoreductase [Denitromonas ohlonensis]TVT48686.1 MAG: SDR family oxidoreductase [Denitromonas halophila]TVO63555.1 SDR family oxidoreductase [Denitromonas ohlonensis]TVO75432.1 SDR family oxidoreductase [Denitromonas ohlonensis]TVT70569.1 MAG: SDR family oxidoreductase [Denitromonas halophila]TVT75691.1 MAG: SDR family oxidoreductase [Denitromonas halophila]
MLYDKNCLAGKRILITGGGTGIGKGLAHHMASHGAEVVIWGRRTQVLEEAAKEINAECGEKVFFQAVDIRNAESVEAAMADIWEKHGALTGVVNNAAANFIAPTKDLSPRGYEAISSTVMDGAFFTTQAAGRRWIEQGLKGSVVSTLVTWIWTGSPYVVPSSMAKAAVHAMTMSLAVEWARYGIRLNAVAPGPFPTDYAWEMLNPTEDSSVGATQADQVPMGRFGEMSELGNLVLLLLSDGADYITGETICIDGGHHLAAPSTFAGLNSMTDAQWAQAKTAAKAASDKAKAQRSV